MPRSNLAWIAMLWGCAETIQPGPSSGQDSASAPEPWVDPEVDEEATAETPADVAVQVSAPEGMTPLDPEWAAATTETMDGILACADGDGFELVERLDAILTVRARVTEGALARLTTCESVVGVGADAPWDYDTAESLPLVRADLTSASGLDGAGLAIAVIDTGINLTVPDFGSCPAPGAPGCAVTSTWDAVAATAAAPDCHASGHGTNVAGIAHAVAPGADIVAVRSSDATCANTGIGASLVWVTQNAAALGVRVVNLSASTPVSQCSVSGWQGSIAALNLAGVAVVVSAGNTAQPASTRFPACSPDVITVGAVYDAAMAGSLTWTTSGCTDVAPSADHVACFSNFGPEVDVLAPGARITAGGQTLGGTSQAAPHVAGAVAVLAAAYPNATNADIRMAFTSSPDLITQAASGLTHPRLDLPSALAALEDGAHILSAAEQEPVRSAEMWFIPAHGSGWSLANFPIGADPADVLIGGHPIPEIEVADWSSPTGVTAEVAPYVLDWESVAVSVWSRWDAGWWFGGPRIYDSRSRLFPGGIENSANWWPVDEVTGTTPVIGLIDGTAPVAALSLDVRNPSTAAGRIVVLVNGGATYVGDVSATSIASLSLDASGFAGSDAGARLTFIDLDGAGLSVRNVRVSVSGLSTWYPGETGDAAEWVELDAGDSVEDGTFSTLLDPMQARPWTLSFTVLDMDAAAAGRLVVNGAWLPLPAPVAPGTRVDVDVTGMITTGRGTRFSWWGADAAEVVLADVTLVDEVSGETFVLEAKELVTDDRGEVAIGGVGAQARTWVVPPPSLPQGTVCGLYHSDDEAPATCGGHDPAVSCPAGFVQRHGGDRGGMSGVGLYWCEAEGNWVAEAQDFATLPEGTVCGLLHTRNQSTLDIRCEGARVEAGACPVGFTYVHLGDEGEEAGVGYSFCQRSGGVPTEESESYYYAGGVCGLSHLDRQENDCDGARPVHGECPEGYTLRAASDRESVEGFAWCAIE